MTPPTSAWGVLLRLVTEALRLDAASRERRREARVVARLARVAGRAARIEAGRYACESRTAPDSHHSWWPRDQHTSECARCGALREDRMPPAPPRQTTLAAADMDVPEEGPGCVAATHLSRSADALEEATADDGPTWAYVAGALVLGFGLGYLVETW